MNKTPWRKGVLALAVSAVLAGAATTALADNVTGSIYGQAKSGDVVTILSTDTGLKREITVDESARFNFSQLPVGRYKVTSGSETFDVVVAVGTGTPVLFGRAGAETVTVTASRISPIDTTSAESTTVFTQEQIQALPVARDITNVALLAPGTVKGDTGFGNLAAIGGSSVAENGYYINGFDVTNIRNFISYAELPFDAIGQQQIKTGGYGAEYGRALGGVINLVTKRGTNEWEFGAAAYWSPDSLKEPGKDVLNRDPSQEPTDTYYVYRSANTQDSLVYNVNAGGPIIQDKLFVFAMYEARDNETNDYNQYDSQNVTNDSPKTLVKIDWNITDDHILELTGIWNKQESDYVSYRNPLIDPTDPSSTAQVPYTGQHGEIGSTYTVRNGGEVLIGKYTGHLTDSLSVSAMWGNLTNDNSYQNPEGLPGAECPAVYDSRGPSSARLDPIGCWNVDQFTIRDPSWGPNIDERTATRLDFEWVISDHTLRFGYDDEMFESGNAGTVYSGGIYHRYYTSRGTVNGVPLAAGTEYVRVRNYVTGSASYEVNNSAIYVEDSWRLSEHWMIYAGLRQESFENLNSDGEAFVHADDMLAPRLGFSWDLAGDSSKKVFGTLGRYFIPVASNTNIRASGIEYLTTDFYTFTAEDPVTHAPTLATQLGASSMTGSTEAPNPATVADTGLEPMHQDELILGYQQLLDNDWMIGIRYINREVKDGMDDYCSHQAFVDWADDSGYTNFDPASMASCIILNPGKDLSLNVDINGDGNLVPVVIPNSYMKLPQYERTYEAIELFWEKTKGKDDWYLQGSYTYGESEGNVEGYVNSTLEQDDPGLTQDFDHYLFEDGAYGYLPNDRRHSFKLFGVYDVTEQFSVSASLLAQSGRPISCNGYIPLDPAVIGVDTGLGNYSASSFYCVDENGDSQLTQRGSYGNTPWTYNIDLGIGYVPSWADGNLQLRADIFNAFNFDEVTEYSETGDLNRAAPERSPNFLNDVNYQSPREVRFTVRYQF